VRIDTREKNCARRRGNRDSANALRQDADDLRSISDRADQELLERGQFAFEAAARFDYVALAAIWITRLIIGASIAATASASRSMISAPRILMSGLDDPLVFAGRRSGTSSQGPCQQGRTQGNQAIGASASRKEAH
jgi:hypothetical protein